MHNLEWIILNFRILPVKLILTKVDIYLTVVDYSPLLWVLWRKRTWMTLNDTFRNALIFFWNPENANQSLVIKQEDRIPERRRTILIAIKTKINELPCNVATMEKTYRTEPEFVREELRNESAFDNPYH